MDLEKVSKNIPYFQNHGEAKKWFKKHFSNKFRIRCSDCFKGKKIYYYHIVRNEKLYKNYMECFSHHVRPVITNMEVFDSYSTVEISENGEVNIFI